MHVSYINNRQLTFKIPTHKALNRVNCQPCYPWAVQYYTFSHQGCKIVLIVFDISKEQKTLP